MSRSKSKPNKALRLLGLTPSNVPSSPPLYAPSVTPSGNHIVEEYMDEDGTIICYDADTNYDQHNRLSLVVSPPRMRLEVIHSNGPISPPTDQNLVILSESTGKTPEDKSPIQKQPRSYSDATAWKTTAAHFKRKSKINTPQSVNQIRKMGMGESNPSNQSHLLLNIFDGSTFDTDIINESIDFDQASTTNTKPLPLQQQYYHKTAPSTPRMSRDNYKRR